MAADPSPAFLFYVKDWRSSRRVQAMTFAERGMYFEMLCEQWDTGSAPGSPAECASALGGTTLEWKRAWPRLRPCFATKTPKGRTIPPGRLLNIKLDGVRLERLRYRKAQRESGLRGARLRWNKGSEPIGSPPKPIAPSMAKNSSDLRDVGSGSDLRGSDLRGGGNGAPASTANARSKRPIFKGQRLVVFEWMLDDLMKLLGPLTEDFGLDAWFSTLDARAAATAFVIPQRDSGAWLQQETLLEAQRRGLPIAVTVSAPAGKQSTRLLAGVANIERQEAQR
jgi:hypothetical protein